MSLIRPFAPPRHRADVRGATPEAELRTTLRGSAQPRPSGRTVEQCAELQLPLVEGPLRRPALRRASQVRGALACADLAAALLTLVAIDLADPGSAVLRPATLAVLPAVLLIARVLGLYHKDEVRLHQTSLDDAPALFQLATLYALAVWLTGHAAATAAPSEAHVMTVLVGFFAAALGLRTLGRSIAGRLVAPERCLVVGETGTARRLARALSAATRNAQVVASIECDSAKSEHITFGELSQAANLARVVDAERVDRLVVAPRYPDIGHVLSLVHTAKSIGVRVTLVPFLGEIVGASAELESLAGVSMLGLPQVDLSRSAQAIKRGMDLLAASAGLALVSPFIAAVAIVIKLDSRGPVFFRQVRTGRDGVRFEILKFRTMVDGADAQKAHLTALNEADGLFKIAEDPRVTRIGRWLRKTSLDELPQLWNVIRGDMSLVGPRPLIEDEDAKVEGWFRHRLRLQPGMTGPWQVLGSARIPLEDMIRIDYLYVANWSLWGDIKILLQTIPYVLARRGM
jgi:exopolysaccharide biosynthesis polyprenyl glycosylphosphotransferase